MALHGSQTSGHCTCLSGNNDFHGVGQDKASASRVPAAGDIGIAFGLSGVFGPAVAGYLIDRTGFTVSYLLMAAICLLTLIPAWLLHETVAHRREHQPIPEAS